MNKIYTILPILLMLSAPALSQDIGSGQQPIEITADKTLEWLQNKKQYVANGNVEATQGDVTILTEKLIADYKDDNEGGNVEIWLLTAQENVRIKNTDSTATGDHAVYNVETGLATLTGKNLKLTTPDQVITANKSMEYNANKGIAKAIGNAKVIREKNTLTAQVITANFTKDKNGKQILNTAKANGDVKIKTPDETLTGNSGVYNVKNNTAEISGDVKIIRGLNTLEGARAEVNLTTNVSKIFGEPNSGKRVKGVFFPSSKNDKKENIK
jgi:lipopolysaccharide export system protein LptA